MKMATNFHFIEKVYHHVLPLRRAALKIQRSWLHMHNVVSVEKYALNEITSIS